LVSFSFFSPPSGAHRDLHSFPTRRSSDLRGGGKAAVPPGAAIPGGRSPARDPGPPAGTPSQDTGPRRAGMGVALVARRGSGRFGPRAAWLGRRIRHVVAYDGLAYLPHAPAAGAPPGAGAAGNSGRERAESPGQGPGRGRPLQGRESRGAGGPAGAAIAKAADGGGAGRPKAAAAPVRRG